MTRQPEQMHLRGVIVKLIGEDRVCEFQKPLLVHSIIRVMCNDLEEVTLGDGCEIETKTQKVPEGAIFWEVQAGWDEIHEILVGIVMRMLRSKPQWPVSNIMPSLKLDEGVHIRWKVLWEDRHGIARLIIELIRHDEG